jgi:hypothetical protein
MCETVTSNVSIYSSFRHSECYPREQWIRTAKKTTRLIWPNPVANLHNQHHQMCLCKQKMGSDVMNDAHRGADKIMSRVGSCPPPPPNRTNESRDVKLQFCRWAVIPLRTKQITGHPVRFLLTPRGARDWGHPIQRRYEAGGREGQKSSVSSFHQ